MQATIQTQGKQFRVSAGDRITVDRLTANVGEEIVFDRVLHVDGETPKVGTPLVQGAKVLGKILDHGQAKKILIYKYKRRKGYHKKQGHRQQITHVQIDKIEV